MYVRGEHGSFSPSAALTLFFMPYEVSFCVCTGSCLVLVCLYAPSLSPLAGTQAPSGLTQHLYLEILSRFRACPQRSAHSYLILQPPHLSLFHQFFHGPVSATRGFFPPASHMHRLL